MESEDCQTPVELRECGAKEELKCQKAKMESRDRSTEVKPQTHPLEHTVLPAHTLSHTLWEALVPGRWLAHSSSLANSSWQAQSLFAVGSVFALLFSSFTLTWDLHSYLIPIFQL